MKKLLFITIIVMLLLTAFNSLDYSYTICTQKTNEQIRYTFTNESPYVLHLGLDGSPPLVTIQPTESRQMLVTDMDVYIDVFYTDVFNNYWEDHILIDHDGDYDYCAIEGYSAPQFETQIEFLEESPFVEFEWIFLMRGLEF